MAKIETMKDIIDQIYQAIRKSGSEDRPSQRKMTALVLGTLEAKGHSCIEGPPGIGKSYAYLIAALVWVLDNITEKVAISTATKGLQDQLFYKDFPRIQKLVEKVCGKRPTAALLKGKGNYVSKNRFNEYVRYCLDSDIEKDEELKSLSGWISSTETGDLNEIELPEYIPASSICVNGTSKDNDCFYLQALERCREANLIITNHHSILSRMRSSTTEDHTRIMVFEDLNVRNIIFDEAHDIERIALDIFTRKVSLSEIKNNISTLLRYADKNGIGQNIKFGRKKAVDILRADVSALWDLMNKFRELQNGSRVAIVNGSGPGPTEEMVLDALKKVGRYIKNAEEYSLKLLSASKRNNINPLIVNESLNELSEIKEEVQRIHGNSRDILVYYSDVRHYPSIIQPDQKTALVLQGKWRHFDSLVFTSATLSLPSKMTSDSWGYFCYGIGLLKNVYFRPKKYIYESLPMPFNYDRVNLYIPAQNAPAPSIEKGRKKYIEYVRSMIADACRRDTVGGIMILIPSYRDMDSIVKAINEVPGILQGRELLMHKRGVPMKNTSAEFTSAPSSNVLLAVGGYWTGVDFPREQLTTLIITRLPFEVKDDPISCIRWMSLPKNRQNDAYYLIIEPAAIIRFRQGIGRLIRTKEDYGNLYVADVRMRGRRFETIVDKLIPSENKHEFIPEDIDE